MDHSNRETNKINEINEILHRQQTLEYLKTPYRPENICPDDYAKKIIGQCNRQNILIKQTRQILANLMIVIGLFCIGAITLGFLLILPTLINIDQPPSVKFHPSPDTPLGQAEIAIENGDYDTARAIFEEEKEKNPINGIILINYAEFCQLEGQHDEAAMLLINYLNDVSGTQNIEDGNGIYMKLKELTGPFSPDVEEAYQNCIAACDTAMENYEFLDSLMESEKYRLALHFCDAMHEENVTANNLCRYYYKCYTQLGEYEECAAYLLQLADQWEKEFSPLNATMLKYQVENRLEELRPFVCESTQQKIDAALLKLRQDS